MRQPRICDKCWVGLCCHSQSGTLEEDLDSPADQLVLGLSSSETSAEGNIVLGDVHIL